MKIHEYQANQLLAEYGIPVQPGQIVENNMEIENAIEKLNSDLYVVKAQIHSGGRGKAGGVKVATSKEQAIQEAQSMLGKRIVTRQNGPDGQIVNKVLISEGASIKREYYLSIVNDSENSRYCLIASAFGGMDIEEIAVNSPDAIIQQHINPEIGLKDYHVREVAGRIGVPSSLQNSFIKIAKQLFKLFIEKDCSLVEINPLAETCDGNIVALDIKIDFDSNALFRHPEVTALRDIAEEDPNEVEASKYDLNYITLNGNIGCMVNGAGLAMATMDMINAYGGHPANFLDVGGSTSVEKVKGAFRLLLSNKNVQVILVNIFGGIVKCDIIANGIVEATKSIDVKIPMIVRLVGNNAEKGMEILRNSGLGIITASTLAEATKLSVEAVRKNQNGGHNEYSC